jgi:hypothetical protein
VVILHHDHLLPLQSSAQVAVGVESKSSVSLFSLPDSFASIAVMGLERNVHREIHVLYPSVDFVAHCLLCNVIEVNPIDGGFDTIAEIHRVDETAHLIRQSGFKFVRDYVSNDISKVGLIEGDRAERSVLLLGEVCIHKAKGSELQNQGKRFF